MIHKKRIALLTIAFLFASILPAAATDGWQEKTDNKNDIKVEAPDASGAGGTTGKSGEIGLLGYIGSVTQGDREVDIDGDGAADYIVPSNDFVSVSVTMEVFAVATISADDKPDFRCGTVKLINENENRPVKIEIQEVNMEQAQGLKLTAWYGISEKNAGTKDEIALKIKPIRENDFPEKDAKDIGAASHLTISEKLSQAIGYKLDGNYTNTMVTEHENGALPKISLVYKISPVNTTI